MSKRNVRSTSKTQNAKPPVASTSLRRAPSHDDVARRAYELWLARGAVHGDPMIDWIAAESELEVRGAFAPRA